MYRHISINPKRSWGSLPMGKTVDWDIIFKLIKTFFGHFLPVNIPEIMINCSTLLWFFFGTKDIEIAGLEA